eukprot:symbB.v1.2.029444.t1/scaffold3217.1/size62816/1
MPRQAAPQARWLRKRVGAKPFPEGHWVAPFRFKNGSRKDGELTISKRGQQVKWPCDNDMVAKFPLQVINSDHKNCSAGRAAFDRLDLSTGEYTPLCYVPEHCFNACGISPETNEIFCREKLGGKTGNNLVRVDCPLNMTEV